MGMVQRNVRADCTKSTEIEVGREDCIFGLEFPADLLRRAGERTQGCGVLECSRGLNSKVVRESVGGISARGGYQTDFTILTSSLVQDRMQGGAAQKR